MFAARRRKKPRAKGIETRLVRLSILFKGFKSSSLINQFYKEIKFSVLRLIFYFFFFKSIKSLRTLLDNLKRLDRER